MSPQFDPFTVVRRVESRVANPIVATVLDSPAHPLLSRWLLLLSYEGRRSGRRFTTPVLYRRDGGAVWLFTPSGKTNWWKNFRGGHPLSVLLRGQWRSGRGTVIDDEDAVVAHLRALTGQVRRVGDVVTGQPIPSEARLRRHASEFVLVRVTFAEMEGSGGQSADRLT